MNTRIIGALLAALMCITMVAPVMAQPSPFVITGHVSDSDGNSCNGAWVQITNTNISESWNADNDSASNYYKLVLDSDDVSAGDVLQIEASGCSESKIVEHTVTQSEMEDGGMFDFDIVFYVESMPDLTVTAIGTPVSLRKDVINPISATVENMGSDNVTSFIVTLEAGGSIVDTATVTSLNASENTTVEFLWTPSSTGNYTLNVTADANGEVIESDETNNSRIVIETVLDTLTATVNVRIEGKNDTVWCGDVTFSSSVLVATDGSIHYLNEPTALGALDEANESGGFGYVLESHPVYGLYISKINSEPPIGWDGWMYRVNYVSPWVGAADYTLADNDEVLWYFGAWTAPPLAIELSATKVNISEEFVATVTAYNGTSAEFEPVGGAEVYIDGGFYGLTEDGMLTISIDTASSYQIHADKGTWADYTRSEKTAVAVLPVETSFIITGHVFDSGGSPCNGAWVKVTNLHTSVSWDAENDSASNYYNLVLDSDNVSVGNVLLFEASGCTETKTMEHTVTQSEIDSGGFSEDITLEAAAEVDNTTTVDMPVSGAVLGIHEDMHESDNEYESITEVLSTGNPAKRRYSHLEHKWTIDVIDGSKANVTFYLEACHSPSSDGDDFVFAYSTDDSTYTDMVTVNKIDDNNAYQTYELPNDLSGTVYIRVKDTDQTAGNQGFDTIHIDQMFIRSVLAQPSYGVTITIDEASQAVAPGEGTTYTVRVKNTGDLDASYNVEMSGTAVSEATIGVSLLNWNTGTLLPNAENVRIVTVSTNSSTPETTYTLTATATCNQDASVIGSATSYLVVSSVTNAMHISGIDMSFKTAGPNTNAVALVMIVDAAGAPVGDATVEGHWSGATTDTDSGLTNGASGEATLDSDKVRNPPSGTVFTFTVDDVSLAGWTYDPDANVEMSDSITV